MLQTGAHYIEMPEKQLIMLLTQLETAFFFVSRNEQYEVRPHRHGNLKTNSSYHFEFSIVFTHEIECSQRVVESTVDE